MKVITQKFLYISFVVNVLKSYLFGATQFSLPAGTPGRQEQPDLLGQIQPITSFQNGKFCEHVIIPNTTCNLYFPIDGSQPDTTDAGVWSGARYIGQPNDSEVTDWWVRVFGGNKAVNFSNVGQPRQPKEPKMGFDVGGFPEVIVKLGSAGLRKQFWRTFRDIAADPVGRVLLYRLLIEIRRIDSVTHEGCCGDGIAMIAVRNNLRHIEIRNTNDGFSFSSRLHCIKFDQTDTDIITMILDRTTNRVATDDDLLHPDTLAIGLYHEMLHWFHFLRHTNRFNQSNSEDPSVYRYLLRSYYGDQSELYTWGSIDDEEIRNILGTPNYDDPEQLRLINPGAFFYAKPANGIRVNYRFFLEAEGRFLNGDDLSENTFRLSTHLHGRDCHMRFGHGDAINLASRRENRFRLANYVARKCYADITGIQINLIRWNIGDGATQ